MAKQPFNIDLLNTAAAVVGRTGSGKSYLARGLVERLLDDKRRVCIVDPTGAWWGLRRLRNGKHGFDVVIFGGDHADVPITDKSGGALGLLIAAGKVPSCIVDISDMSNNEQTRFLTDFFETLYQKWRGPLHLVLDEADLMAPQNPMPDQRRMQGAVNKIVRRGRIKGFRPMLITQRPQVIDKSVLSQSNTMIALRVTSPQDRKAIEDWIKGNADAGEMGRVVKSLASLKTGEGWVWAPGADLLERMTFPSNRTHDSSKAPEDGDEDVEPLALKDLDLDELRGELASEAAERETAKKARAAPPPPTAAEVESIRTQMHAAFQNGYDKGLQDGEERGRTAGIAIGLLRAHEALRKLTVQEIEKTENGRPEQSQAPRRPVSPPPLSGRVAAAVTPASLGGGALNSAGRKLLDVLDTNPPVKRTWGQAATLAGLKARGGHFNSGKKALLDSGLVVEDGGLVRVAHPRNNAVPAVAEPAGLVAMWSKSLSGAAPKILQWLFDNGGEANRADIALGLGMKPTGGHWNSGWKELKDNEIVTVDRDDFAQLTELFRS